MNLEQQPQKDYSLKPNPETDILDKRSTFQRDSKIVIVGAGCFGISTAYHLLKRGYTDITVLDRAPELPAVDAASSDLNKIVRSAYHDPFYARLAKDAIELWKNREEWGDTYHESGVVVLSADKSLNAEHVYFKEKNLGARVRELPDEDAMRSAFPPDVRLGKALDPSNVHVYINQDGGWADATKGVAIAIDKVKALGGKVIKAKCVATIIKTSGMTSGVQCTDDTIFEADLVILATGAWTASTFPELRLEERCRASGQSIATIQLTEDEARRYRSCPVALDFGPSEFYTFPPNDQNVMKLARHAAGYVNYTSSSSGGVPISAPRTIYSHGTDGLSIPRHAATLLRTCFESFYPELADKPFISTRLCWYTDSPDADWVIDIHPSDPSLMLMTAGSGHGYKFLPIIGQLAVERLEGTMSTELQKKFAVNRVLQAKGNEFPRDVRKCKVLDPTQLCTAQDLLQ